MASISYAILACNEHEELDKLLSLLLKNIRSTDEIVIVLDQGNTTKSVYDVINLYDGLDNVFICENPLNKDFAAQKNFLNSLCTKDYIFQIDADELIHEYLLKNLSDILDTNKNVELINIPRINIVNGITQDHIIKWGWLINDNGWINFPDYQSRIYANKPYITWKNKVHERIFGYMSIATLPAEEEYCLIHTKEIKKQEQQNNFYSQI